MPDTRWMEAIERWRSLPAEERRRRHLGGDSPSRGEFHGDGGRAGGRGLDSGTTRPPHSAGKEIPNCETATSSPPIERPKVMAMPRRRLPIGIQNFRELREEDCYYVDKTAYIRRLLDEGKHYFLSRPRRFGKSLFLDTCKELFEGNQALFEGLDIHDHWDWSVRHPVLRLSFGSGHFKEPGHLHANLMDQLDAIERRTGVVAEAATSPGRFARQIEALHQQTGERVVVLIDEYDKPVLDALDTPEIARANRDFLRGLYATIKDSDADIRFSFITGVSKFSKVSLFSGLNNLTRQSPWTHTTRRSAATRRPTWIPCSRRNSLAWTGTRSASGTTATTGSARKRSTTHSTSCCCFATVSSAPGGLRPARRRSWSKPCSNAG